MTLTMIYKSHYAVQGPTTLTASQAVKGPYRVIVTRWTPIMIWVTAKDLGANPSAGDLFLAFFSMDFHSPTSHCINFYFTSARLLGRCLVFCYLLIVSYHRVSIHSLGTFYSKIEKKYTISVKSIYVIPSIIDPS